MSKSKEKRSVVSRGWNAIWSFLRKGRPEVFIVVMLIATILMPAYAQTGQTALKDKMEKVYNLIFEAGLFFVAIMFILAALELGRGGSGAREMFLMTGIAAGVVFSSKGIAEYLKS